LELKRIGAAGGKYIELDETSGRLRNELVTADIKNLKLNVHLYLKTRINSYIIVTHTPSPL
jgi:hypothetical protein